MNDQAHMAGGPDCEPRHAQSPEKARQLRHQAVTGMFDALDNELAQIVSDLYDGSDVLYAVLASAPMNAQAALVVSDTDFTLIVKTANGTPVAHIVPINAIESMRLRPGSSDRAGALAVVTAAEGVVPPFPLETNFGWFRAVAVRRIVRHIQGNAPQALIAKRAGEIFSALAAEMHAQPGAQMMAPHAVMAVPQQVMAAPQQVMPAPAQVAAAPQQVAAAPQQVAPAPQQVAPAAASASSVGPGVPNHMVGRAVDLDNPQVLAAEPAPAEAHAEPAPAPVEEAAPAAAEPAAAGGDGGEDEWFLYRDDAEHGPYPKETVEAWYESGEIDERDYIRSASMTEWMLPDEAFGGGGSKAGGGGGAGGAGTGARKRRSGASSAGGGGGPRRRPGGGQREGGPRRRPR